MIAGLLKVDEAIYESNKIICRQISRLGESTRGEVSQEVLESLRHFVEHIILKEYANGGDIEDTHENLKAAVKYVKNEPQLIHLSRFHHFLQVSSSHRVLKEHNAERLMIRYYEYLFRIRKFLYDKYSMVVLENLEQFPLDTNDELTEYYTKIATVVDRYNAPIHGGFRYDRFYVQKIKPFFINNKIYYEVAFVPANDNASKTDSIIAFTDMEITSYYAVKFAIADNSIEIFDQRMPIRVIVDWEVNIRPCELKNFNRILDNSLRDYGSAEQRNISQFLTKTGLSLSEVIMFSDEAFAKLRSQLVPSTKAIHFFDCLEKCRDIIKQNAPGSNILRYLLHHLTNRVLRKQYKDIWYYLTSVGLAEDVSIFSSAESYESQRNFAAMIKLFSTSFLILLTVISCANVFNVITTSLNMRKREFAVLRSVGMTVNKLFAMLCIENLRNGLLAILIGGISSLPLCYLIYKSIVVGAVIDFVFPLGAFVISSLAMFLIMFLTSLYGLWKIKNGDIIADVRNDFV